MRVPHSPDVATEPFACRSAEAVRPRLLDVSTFRSQVLMTGASWLTARAYQVLHKPRRSQGNRCVGEEPSDDVPRLSPSGDMQTVDQPHTILAVRRRLSRKYLHGQEMVRRRGHHLQMRVIENPRPLPRVPRCIARGVIIQPRVWPPTCVSDVADRVDHWDICAEHRTDVSRTGSDRFVGHEHGHIADHVHLPDHACAFEARREVGERVERVVATE